MPQSISLFLCLPAHLKKDAHKEMVDFKHSGFSVILEMKILWLDQILPKLNRLNSSLIQDHADNGVTLGMHFSC